MKRLILLGVLLVGGVGTLSFWAISVFLNLEFSGGLPPEPEKVLVPVQTAEDYQRRREAEERQAERASPFSGLPFIEPSSSTSVSPSPATVTPQPTPSPTATASPQPVVEALLWVADERLVFAIEEARKIVASNPTIGLRLTPNSEIDVFYAGNGVINTLRNENDRIVISISSQQNTVTIHVVEKDLYLYVTPDGSYYVVKGNGDQPEYLTPRKDAVEVGRILQRLQEDFKAIPVANPERGQRQDNETTASPSPTPAPTTP